MVDKDQKWLEYKALQLKDLGAATPLVKTEKRWRWRAKLSPNWFTFKENHYGEDGKIIKMEVLDKLKDIGLAVWFGDKGYWVSKKKIGLRTTTYKEQNEIIIQYFNEVGIPCFFRKYGDTGRVVFNEFGTEVFLRLITHRFPYSLLKKLRSHYNTNKGER